MIPFNPRFSLADDQPDDGGSPEWLVLNQDALMGASYPNVLVPIDPETLDRRPYDEDDEGLSEAQLNSKYGPFPDLPGVAVFEEALVNPAASEAQELLGDPLLDAMVLKATSSAKAKTDDAPVTSADIENWLYNHVSLLYDDRIPGSHEPVDPDELALFDERCLSYSFEHPDLWERHDERNGYSHAEAQSARRGLHLLWALDPIKHKGRGLEEHGAKEFHTINELPDAIIERYALMAETRNPRWVTGDVYGTMEPGHQAAVERKADMTCLPYIKPRVRRAGYLAISERVSHGYTHNVDMCDVMLRNAKAEKLKCEAAIEDGDTSDSMAMRLARVENIIDLLPDQMRDSGLTMLRQSRELQLDVLNTYRALEYKRDECDDPEVKEAIDRLWVQPYRTRALSIYDDAIHVGEVLERNGFGQDVYETCPMAVPKDKLEEHRAEHKRRIVAECDAEVDRLQREVDAEHERREAIERAQAQRQHEEWARNYDHDRAVRAAIGSPLPGDEYSAAELDQMDREDLMRRTGLSAEEIDEGLGL